MSEFKEQLKALEYLADPRALGMLNQKDRAAIRAVLDQRKRLRAALETLTWKYLRMSCTHERKDIMADYLEAIRPETPAEESSDA